MSIENELITFLEKNISDKSDKRRNIDMIMYFYGFRQAIWPTLEETGQEFNNISREAVRQKIDKHFKKKVTIEDIPSISEVSQLIVSQLFWNQAQIEEKLKPFFPDRKLNIRGLFNLFETLGIKLDYEIYTPELIISTRKTIDTFDQFFIIADSEIKNIKKIYGRAAKLPGLYGIANLSNLRNEFADFNKYSSLIKDLISNSPQSWVRISAENFWYLFENRDNVLINFSEKVFSVARHCMVEKLAISFSNALNRRSIRYSCPDENLISTYLKSSIYFECNQNILLFTGETSELMPIELDAVNFLGPLDSSTSKELKTHLLSKGYEESYINKIIYNSPLIYVDKTDGRYYYKFSFIGKSNDLRPREVNIDDRYWVFVRKLRRKEETDLTSEQKVRTEQTLLSQWLFEGKKYEYCAICGKKFNVSALDAAHKKNRKKCNKAERLDPYIVMPLCKFGCHYLYDQKYIYIQDGKICAGVSISGDGHEKEFVNILLGKKIDRRWLEGNKEYFEKP